MENTFIELNKIYCGDNLALCKSMPDESVDLILTSPPYDDLRNYNGYSWDFESLAKELVRILKRGGIIVWVVGDSVKNGSETGVSFKQALYFMSVSLKLHDTMIYKKNNFANPSSNRYHQTFEYMFVFSKGKPKTFNPIKDRANKYVGQKAHGKNRTKSGWVENKGGETKSDFGMRHNVWEYTTGGGHVAADKFAHQHPAIFPEKLAEDHIISWSNAGDLVFDPFLGSGTTAKMAKKLGRKYLGVDISQEYCDIAQKRINAV